MRKTPLLSKKSMTSISVADLEHTFREWFLDGEIRQLSGATISIRRLITDKLIWFLTENHHEQCGTQELKAFLAYLGRSHQGPEGRWNNGRKCSQVRPLTIRTYHAHLRTCFRWMVAEGNIDDSPMESIAAPIIRTDQVQPFSEAQIEALVRESKRSRHPKRDEVIVRFLYDTGMRASELCSLKTKNLDVTGRRCVVQGKGNKYRTVYFGKQTAKALIHYLRESPREPVQTVFYSDRGTQTGEALRPNGLLQLVGRIGTAAKIEATRCSPHTFRHSFAVQFLRAGGNVFSLKEILGHTTLTMVNRYVSLAQADIENQHRQFSPGDRLGTRKS